MTVTSPAKTILLVEDEALIAMKETEILKEHGYKVLTAYSGEKAIETVRNNTIDLILMDIDLGKNKMLGTKAAEIILEDNDIPIVFLTSHSEKEIVEKVKGITRYGYVLKNSGEFVLLEAINMAFELHKTVGVLKDKEEQLELAMDASDHGYWDWDIDTNEAYFSPRYYRMLGYQPGEFPMKFEAWENLLHPEDKERILSQILNKVEAVKPFEFEFRLRTKNGDWKWIRGRGKSFEVDEKGKPHRVVGTHEDISDYRYAEEELRKNQALLNETEKAGKIGGWEFDVESMTQIWTEETFRILGIDPERGEPKVSEGLSFVATSHLKMAEQAVQRAVENGESYDQEWEVITVEGERRWVHSVGTPHQRNGKTVTVSGSFQDITKRKNLELKLAENERLLQATGRMAKVGGWELDAKSLEVFWTEETYRIHEIPIGYNPPLDEAVNFFHPDDRDTLSDAIDHALKEGKPYDMELRFITAKGKHLWVHTICTPIMESAGVVKLTGTFQDITDRRVVEESLRQSEEKYERLMKNSPDVIYRMSLPDGRYEYVSSAVSELFGYSPEELQENHLPFRKVIHPDWYDYFTTEWNNLLKGDVPLTYEYQIVKKNGEVRWVNQRNMLYTDEHDNPMALEGIVSDITEQKNAEEQRDILMHELNHRTKNNLMMISSLIKMKDSSLGDTTDLTDLIQKTDTIRLAYDKLQQIGDSTYIDVRGYIQGILSAVFTLSRVNIGIEEEIENIYLEAKTAVPLGLIINEIATNAIKHGFSDSTEAKFNVAFKIGKSDNKYILRISNNGKAFPKEIDFDNPESLGLQLVQALVQQLQGTIDLRREPHPVFTIRFPAEE